MTWCRIECNLLDNPKLAEAGPLASNLYFRAILYSTRHLTDGHIKRRTLYALGDLQPDRDDFGKDGPPTNDALAQRLVDAGLWTVHPENGWLIHKYLEYQPSRSEVEAKLAAQAEAGRKAGLASGAARRAKRANETRTESFNDRSTDDERSRERNANGVVRQSLNDFEHTYTTHTQTQTQQQNQERHGPLTRTDSSRGTNVPVKSTDVASVVAHYCAVHPRRGAHLKPGHADWKRIEQRLREGFTVEQLCAAVDGNRTCSWHAERRAHSIAMVFRNAGKVETFIDIAERGNPTPKPKGWLGATFDLIRAEGSSDGPRELRSDDGRAEGLLSAPGGRDAVDSEGAEVPSAPVTLLAADGASGDEPSVESVPDWVSERWKPRRALPAGRA